MQRSEMKSRRRRCAIFGRSQVLEAFDKANESIMARSMATSRRIADEGVKHMSHIAEEFLKACELN